MSMHLDLDDAAAPHPLALRQLAELRAEVAELRTLARDGFDLRAEQRDDRDHLRAERERLRGYFLEALADKGITWPGEVDILYDKCFVAPYVPDEDA